MKASKRTSSKPASKLARSQTAARGTPGSEQDPQRRMGNFTGTGEHARKGGRTTGIVGQKKQKFRNDSGRQKRKA